MKYLIPVIFTLLSFISFSGEIEKELVTESGKLYGTLLEPKKNPTKTLIIIHAGSGPTDRNGNQAGMKNNSLKFLAEELAKKDIATLRIDKRGVGASKDAGKSEIDMRFEDFVNDLEAWTKLMRSEGKFDKIVLLGHSEGSLISMLVAVNNELVDAYISLSGAGVPADQILKEQLATQPEAFKEEIYHMIDTLKAGKSISDVKPVYAALFRESVQPYVISWLKYDPALEIQKLKIPTLLINGTTDIQVSTEQVEILKKAKPEAQMVKIENMNHVLKECKSKNLSVQMEVYSDDEKKIVKELPKVIAQFVNGLAGENP